MSAPGHVEVASKATATPADAPASATSVRHVSGYSVPGEGSSTAIAIITVFALLLLWCRLVAVALIRPLAWELPYALGAALEMAKRQKKKG